MSPLNMQCHVTTTPAMACHHYTCNGMSPLNLQWHVTTTPTAVTKYCAAINQWIHQFQALHFCGKIIKILLYWTASLSFQTQAAVQLADHGWREENHKSANHYNWSLNIDKCWSIYRVPWVIKSELIFRDAISLCYCKLIILKPIQ